VAGNEADGLWHLTVYIGFVAVTSLLLAAAAAERRRQLIEVVENEKRLRAVVADQPDLICRFEPGGRLTFVNAAFCQFHAKEEKNCSVRIFPDAG